MAKTIELTKGKSTIVDDADFEHLASLRKKWCMNGGYAYNLSLGSLHRYLMRAPEHLDVDHVNGDKLDNRRANMRFANDAQNQQNRKKKFNGHSKFKGAHWDRRNGLWLARIRVDGKLKYLGCFDTDLEAAIAYNEGAQKYFGEFAAVNDLTGAVPDTKVRCRKRQIIKGNLK